MTKQLEKKITKLVTMKKKVKNKSCWWTWKFTSFILLKHFLRQHHLQKPNQTPDKVNEKNLLKNDDIDDEDDNLMNVNKSEFTSKTGRLDILSNKLLNL